AKYDRRLDARDSEHCFLGLRRYFFVPLERSTVREPYQNEDHTLIFVRQETARHRFEQPSDNEVNCEQGDKSQRRSADEDTNAAQIAPRCPRESPIEPSEKSTEQSFAFTRRAQK